MDSEVVLVTGIVGALAQSVARALREQGHRVVGVDYRPMPVRNRLPDGVTVYRASYDKTRIEEPFRRHRPSMVLHLGRVGDLKEGAGLRFDLNVVGNQRITSMCLKYGTRRMVVLSTFHIYGADALNHTPICEGDPLRAGPGFPEIADAIQLDNQAVMDMYRHPQLQTVVLRPTNVIGPIIQNAMSRFLRQRTLPVMMGFNPMVQFVHERDLTQAILAAAHSTPIGIFNVAGQSAMPWRTAVHIAGARAMPTPSTVARLYLRASGILTATLPPYLINFIKHPCVISDEALRRTFDWAPVVDDQDAIRSTVEGIGG